MIHSDFSVTKIVLHGPDGQSISNRMSVTEAVEWLKEKTGYDGATVNLEFDTLTARAQLIASINDYFDDKAKAFEKSIKDRISEVAADARQGAREIERKFKLLDEQMPAINRLVADIQYDQRTKREKAQNDDREKKYRESLAKEMLVPGRKCGTCGSPLYDKGIAYNEAYSHYLCAPCGESMSGTRCIIKPEEVRQDLLEIKKDSA